MKKSILITLISLVLSLCMLLLSCPAATSGNGGAFIELITIFAAGNPFTMGDGSYGPPADHSGVSQTISYNFQMSKYEITNDQFAQFIADGGYSTSSYWTTNGWTQKTSGVWTQPAKWTDTSLNGTNQPVVAVSWYEAVAFCNWLSIEEGLTPAYNSAGRASLTASGYRLPTEVEWEYAGAKGASGEAERLWAYTGGFVDPDDWDCNKVVSSLCSVATQSADVGSKSPSGDTPQGLADMSGNANEWCSDNDQADGDVGSGPNRYYFVDDDSSTRFVLRGGEWGVNSDEYWLRAANRGDADADDRGDKIGFRVVRP